eukprot:COSAG01_NODE_21034_length_921_cov_2.475669_1_plen_228_part_10
MVCRRRHRGRCVGAGHAAPAPAIMTTQALAEVHVVRLVRRGGSPAPAHTCPQRPAGRVVAAPHLTSPRTATPRPAHSATTACIPFLPSMSRARKHYPATAHRPPSTNHSHLPRRPDGGRGSGAAAGSAAAARASALCTRRARPADGGGGRRARAGRAGCGAAAPRAHCARWMVAAGRDPDEPRAVTSQPPHTTPRRARTRPRTNRGLMSASSRRVDDAQLAGQQQAAA